MKKLTNQIFINKINLIHGENKILPLEDYKNNRTKINFKCNECENKWNTLPASILSGNGCPKCGLIKAKNTIKWDITTDEFIKKINPDFLQKITILSEYNGVKNLIKVKCNHCKNEWDSKPLYLKKGYGCKICGHLNRVKKITITHDDFEKKINLVHNNEINLLSEYKGNNHEIKFICNNCDKISKKNRAKNLLSRGCPNCIFSKGEKKIQTILEENKISFIREYKINTLKDANNLRFDFAILDNNGELLHLIEYDGKQHFEPVKIFGGEKRFLDQIKKDKMKNEYCNNNNIKLIRIKYSDIDKININLLLNK